MMLVGLQEGHSACKKTMSLIPNVLYCSGREPKG